VKGRSPGRVCVSKIHINRLIAFLKFKRISNPAEVTRAHLSQYQQSVEASTLAKTTQKDVLGCAILFFRYLCDYRYLAGNPALVIEPARKGRSLPRPILTAEEFRPIFDSSKTISALASGFARRRDGERVLGT